MLHNFSDYREARVKKYLPFSFFIFDESPRWELGTLKIYTNTGIAVTISFSRVYPYIVFIRQLAQIIEGYLWACILLSFLDQINSCHLTFWKIICAWQPS